jgi:hypothetical protein
MQADEIGARQGAEEAWIDGVWRPFWAALSAEQRLAYLGHWKASENWREWIRFVCEQPADFDAAEDAADSERLSGERAAAKQAAGEVSFLSRLFKRSGKR